MMVTSFAVNAVNAVNAANDAVNTANNAVNAVNAKFSTNFNSKHESERIKQNGSTYKPNGSS